MVNVSPVASAVVSVTEPPVALPTPETAKSAG
jgi:hypothetical protein